MKKFLLVCNFKMNSVALSDYQNAIKDKKINNLVLCPNFCDIKEYCKLKQNGIMIGAQNVSEYISGAYTGEVSAKMLKDAGADFCIVGHSERKKYFYETHLQTNRKIKNLIASGVTPIVCVGEDIKKDEDFASRFVLMELNEILQDVDLSKIIVAYEPIWAIGTGLVPTNQHIEFVINAIKKYTGIGMVLYGGSFGVNNYKQIASINGVDGALIGGASLKPDLICEI